MWQDVVGGQVQDGHGQVDQPPSPPPFIRCTMWVNPNVVKMPEEKIAKVIRINNRAIDYVTESGRRTHIRVHHLPAEEADLLEDQYEDMGDFQWKLHPVRLELEAGLLPVLVSLDGVLKIHSVRSRLQHSDQLDELLRQKEAEEAALEQQEEEALEEDWVQFDEIVEQEHEFVGPMRRILRRKRTRRTGRDAGGRIRRQ